MPTNTPNLNLVKPLVTEKYIVAVANANNDIIDAAINDLDLAKIELPTLSKTTAIDADSVLLIDSAASDVVKKWTIANIKANLKTYFDTLYQALLVSGTNIKSVNGSSLVGSGNLALEETIIIALSDEATALTTGTAKATFRIPFACKLTAKLPRINVNTVSSSGLVTVDVNKNGTTILSTKLTIDATEKSSVDATTPCVLASTPTTFTDDDEITCDIDVAGTGAKGLKLTLFVERT